MLARNVTLLIVILLALALPAAEARSADKAQEYLLQIFDSNVAAATYARYCLKSVNPETAARFEANVNTVGQVLLNRLVASNPHVSPHDLRSWMRQRQAGLRYEGERQFMSQGCTPSNAKEIKAHYQRLSAMSTDDVVAALPAAMGRPGGKLSP